MKKDSLNSVLRSFVKQNLSPTQEDIQFVSNIYQSFNDLLGVNNCVQIGSYPRYTAVKPLHDLDILYIIGEWSSNITPTHILNELAKRFEKDYKNPTKYKVNIEVQTHSISFKYMQGETEVFAVDLVPALKYGVNEFGKNLFYVPEIIKQKRSKRKEYYLNTQKNHVQINWIKTDPFGYIEVASNINKQNTDFRKSVKFIKGWKNCCKQINENFKLKSFHLEQLITRNYQNNIGLDIFDSVFKFFTELKSDIQTPIIKDRADHTKYIDSYLLDLTMDQKEIIENSIDAVLIAFENINDDVDVNRILKSGFYKRKSTSEKYLFDQKIPVLIDKTLIFEIDGLVEKSDGWRSFHRNLSSTKGVIDSKNSVKFKVITNNTSADLTKWKVKNDDKSMEPRGEITDRQTLRDPEKTKYMGHHYVDCFAIKNNICIAKDRVDVFVRQ